MDHNNEEEEIYIPYNFNSKELLIKENWKPYLVERHHQKLDFILHQIYINRVCNSRYERRDFVHLSAKHYFERYLYGRDYNRLKPLLLKYGIIEDNGSYTVADEEKGLKGIPKGYRLTDQYDVEHRRILVDKDTTLFKNIKRFRASDLAIQDGVTQWINTQVKNIGIDKETAVAYVESWYRNAIANPKSVKLKWKQRGRSFIEVIEGKRQKYLHSIYSIADGTAFNATRPDQDSRVYHPIAILWKELRQFLFIKERPTTLLYNLDISNSQPLFLARLVLDSFPDRDYPDDVIRYLDLVSGDNVFYKYLADKLNVSVKDFKIQLFTNVFFAKNNKRYDTKEDELFMNEFPSVYKIIKREKEQDNADLALKLQKLEAQAIIDGVLGELMTKYNNRYFIASIHDSIIVEEELIEEVKQLIVKHVERIAGIKPHVKKPELLNYYIAEILGLTMNAA